MPPSQVTLSEVAEPEWQETVFFVRDDVQFAGVTLHKFLAGNITMGDDLPADGLVFIH